MSSRWPSERPRVEVALEQSQRIHRPGDKAPPTHRKPASKGALADPQTHRRRTLPGNATLALRARRKFLGHFPGGFRDETYLDWERNYKVGACERWNAELDRKGLGTRIEGGRFDEIAAHAVRVESRTNLLFSFEKMALRDAVRSPRGARSFALGLNEWLYGAGAPDKRFERWCEVVASLPRRQTRVLTWPIVTVFGFLAQPERHMFLKPTVTRVAARKYGFEFEYASRPSWNVYASLLRFAETIRRDVRDLRPRDMIDLQSFVWVQGSDEYPD